MAKRRLLINCDDLGYHPTFNEAIVEILSRGIVRSTSLMPAAPHFDDAIRRLAHAGIDRVGVHLTLGSEYRRLPIRPLCDSRNVPSLVGEDGVFPREISQVRETIVAEEAESELRSQIERVRQCGLRLTHLDGHMFFYEPDVGGPHLLAIARKLAHAYDLPLRCRALPALPSNWPGPVIRPKRREGAASPSTEIVEFCSLETGRPRPASAGNSNCWAKPALPHQGAPDVVMLWKGADSVEARWAYYLEFLANHAAKLHELIIHPGKDIDAMREFSSTGRRRLADYLFFRSSEFERVIAENDLEIITWDDVVRCDAC